VPKDLPPLDQVTQLVRKVGGVSSAAHLGSRASRSFLLELKAAGVDGVEVIHPGHDDKAIRRIRALARTLNMLPTGGSDWHGDRTAHGVRAGLGSLQVPESWLNGIETLHDERVAG
jgi:predicted metal-dependent phosphoesterase TrpH